VTKEQIINLGSRVYFRPKDDSVLSGRDTISIMHEFFSCADAVEPVVHHWKRGEVVFFDNARYVHGRGVAGGSARGSGDRQLKRIWLSRIEDTRDLDAE
jgi:alpha-ketoglutarate-dependent taurine dioxygenase